MKLLDPGRKIVSNTDEQRWKQRLENFGRVLSRLDDACNMDSYSDLERVGLIQTFMFTYEVAWKTLRDLLFIEGYDGRSPRDAIRQGFEAEHLDEDDCETFLDALENRNMMSHAYQEKETRRAEALIKEQYHPMLRRLHRTLERKRL